MADEICMVTKLPNVTMVQTDCTSLYEYNANLDKQLDCLDGLIKDAKTFNEAQWKAGTTKHMDVTWYTKSDESEYTSHNMWKLLYIMAVKHDAIILFDFDVNTDPKYILSSKIRIFPIEYKGKLIHCAELI